MQNQQGDVVLFQSLNDGDIEVIDGVVTMNGGLQTAAYLSLFGGNLEDDGVTAGGNWWGNLEEVEPARKYRSETQRLLNSIPAVSGNLLLIQAAAERDLAWFLAEGVAVSVAVSVALTGVKRIEITVNIDGNAEVTFAENWGSF